MLELGQQVEEGRKVEENIKKQYLEKEEQHQVEVNILKGKLEEKNKPSLVLQLFLEESYNPLSSCTS